jgi:hypothetical protein
VKPRTVDDPAGKAAPGGRGTASASGESISSSKAANGRCLSSERHMGVRFFNMARIIMVWCFAPAAIPGGTVLLRLMKEI